MLLSILKFIFYLPLSIFVYPIRVVGKKNIPSKGRVMLCPNHQTLNDPVIIALKLRRRFNYMAKAPLFKYKFSNWILRKFGAYPVHHKENDIEAVKTTLKLLKSDKAVCIFPEGARLVTAEAHDLKNGVVNFAFKTNTPIVPAMFVKKTNAFVFNKLIIGKPFNLCEMEQFKDRKVDKELLNEASMYLKDQMHSLLNEYNQTKENKRRNKVFAKKARLLEKHRTQSLKYVNKLPRIA